MQSSSNMLIRWNYVNCVIKLICYGNHLLQIRVDGNLWYGCAFGQSAGFKYGNETEYIPTIPNLNKSKMAATTDEPDIQSLTMWTTDWRNTQLIHPDLGWLYVFS